MHRAIKWLLPLLLVGLGLLLLRDTLVRHEGLLSWQTVCAVPVHARADSGINDEPVMHRLGRPAPYTRTAYLFVADDGLRVWDIPNNEQFLLRGDTFHEVEPVPCPHFSAGSYTFSHRDAWLSACQVNGNQCISIRIKPETMPFTYAENAGAVFVGTSHGDALLFSLSERRWCRMEQDEEGIYACPPGPLLPVVTEPSNQFYSSVRFDGRTLIGEYPTGQIFEFDGKRLFPSELTPPPFREGRRSGYESQSLAVYYGDLYVGYWPDGSLWRYNGSWQEPMRLFSDPDTALYPYHDEAEQAGLVFNFFGRRVSSLVPYDGYLYASTSNKGDWSRRLAIELPEDAERDYGVIWRIQKPGCT